MEYDTLSPVRDTLSWNTPQLVPAFKGVYLLMILSKYSDAGTFLIAVTAWVFHARVLPLSLLSRDS